MTKGNLFFKTFKSHKIKLRSRKNNMVFTIKKINKLKIAVGEACCNAIEHGNKF